MTAPRNDPQPILQTPRPLAKSRTHADMEARPSPPRPRRSGVRGLSFRFVNALNGNETAVAKVTPGEFVNQVRAEGRKVVWPTMKETRTTAIMVMIMTALLGIFFFAVDSGFSALVKFLLGLLG